MRQQLQVLQRAVDVDRREDRTIPTTTKQLVLIVSLEYDRKETKFAQLGNYERFVRTWLQLACRAP